MRTVATRAATRRPEFEARWDVVLWSESYSVGNAAIDADHQRLLALFNDFSNAVNGDKGELAIRSVLDELRDYAHDHFRREESLMLEHRYPDYHRHKRMHDTFERQIADVASHLDMGSGDMCAFLLSFLAKWLTGHILSADQQFGVFLAERGISEH